MILARGTLYETAQQGALLDRLEDEINTTRARRTLSAQAVVAALDALGRRITDGRFDARLAALGLGPDDVAQAAALLRRDNLEYRLQVELGPAPFAPSPLAPPDGQACRSRAVAPLGTLLHIAAGNADGLPVLSLAEGLVTGNVNILKLPQADSGLSLEIVYQLLELEPALADFIYVFDTPSTDLAALRRMAACCDGIVTWGGDAAVAAVRQFAPVGAKLIEWGHRLSFAYISGYENKAAELAALARHIVDTRQLLCSSCQVIFLDTTSMEEVHTFCKEFLPILEQEAGRRPAGPPGEAAEATLRRLADELERVVSGGGAERNVYSGARCRLTACEDDALELSEMFASCLVKRLPSERLLPALRREKGRLQTAGLLCAPEKRAALTALLARSGLTRITRAGNMSAAVCGEAHDGEYPLRRYVRMVETEP